MDWNSYGILCSLSAYSFGDQGSKISKIFDSDNVIANVGNTPISTTMI